ncbi:MAG: SGNH/GDSL hydrolase family protein [Ideonella sp.]|nr:SGNH/GDSL hydrolase family protein [Ideonella sp.]MCC7456394.1 SGNH/GDSL hydrolase family protein [Nitrospira sp.]
MSLALKLVLSPLLVAQALHTRAKVPRLPEAAGPRAGVHGHGAQRLRLLIAGDSSAAGVGVATQRDALAGQLLARLAQRLPLQLHWQLLAASGLTTAQTLELLRATRLDALDLAVIVTGVNDVVEQVATARAVRARAAIADLLRSVAGARHIVFCPLPPVQQFPSLPQPLRWMAGADAQRHNRALREWVAQRAHAQADVSAPDLGALQLGRDSMAADGFHPGAAAYRAVADALAAHIADAVWPRLRR